MIRVIVLFVVSAFVFLACSKDESPTTTQNQKPKILSISANPSTIQVNELTTVSCEVMDPDGDNITTSWSANNGSFPDGISGISVKWKAPSDTGAYAITVTANDGRDSQSESILVIVESETTVCPPTVTYAGKTYNTVLIGNQCWLKENLNVGTMVNSTTQADSQRNNGIIEKYCYDNNPANCETYGGLYQWNEAMQYSKTPGAQGICPPGWHIPTLEEVAVLKASAGNNANNIKAIGQGTGANAGTDSTGFSALLSGMRSAFGAFHYLSIYTYFWTSTEHNTETAYMLPALGAMYNTTTSKTEGYSIRCIMD